MKLLGKATSKRVTGYLNMTSIMLETDNNWSKDDQEFVITYWCNDTKHSHSISQGAFELFEGLLRDAKTESTTQLIVEEDDGQINTYMTNKNPGVKILCDECGETLQ